MKILIADDHAVVREGLAALFERQPDLQVVGTADNGEKAVALAKELAPDLIIMDIAMPRLNGVSAIGQIVKCRPDVKIIVLSMHSMNAIVTEALKAGCHGYVLKSSLFKEISAAVEAVAKGERYLSPEITRLVVEGYMQGVAPDDSQGKIALTDRERQVLQMVAEGCSTKQIGQRLDLSLKAVEAIRHRIKDKLHLDSVADLTKYAIKEGLTSAQG